MTNRRKQDLTALSLGGEPQVNKQAIEMDDLPNDFKPLRVEILEMLEKHNSLLKGKALSAQLKTEMANENDLIIAKLTVLDDGELYLKATNQAVETQLDRAMKRMQEDIVKQIKKEVRNNKLSQEIESTTVEKPEDRLLVIEPDGKTYAEVVRLIEEKGKLVSDKIRIDKPRATKKGKIITKCRSTEERDKLVANCSAAGLTARKAENRLARFIITRLPNKEDEEIKNELLARRTDTQIIEESFKLVKSFETKNGKKAFIFTVEAEAAKAIERDPHFYLGSDRYRATIHVNLIQCFRCQAFGHKATDNVCKEEHCHQCADKHPKEEHCQKQTKCINCVRAGKHGANNHNSRSGLCPILRDARQALIDRESFVYGQ